MTAISTELKQSIREYMQKWPGVQPGYISNEFKISIPETFELLEEIKEQIQTQASKIPEQLNAATEIQEIVPEWETPAHKEVNPFDLDYEEVMAQVQTIQPSQQPEVAVADEPDISEVTDEEIIDTAVRLLKEGKSDPQVKISLLAEFENIDADEFIEIAHLQLSELINKQEAEIETAHAEEDEARQLAIKATDEKLAAEYEAKKNYVEAKLLKQNKGFDRNWTPQQVHQLFIELEEVRKREASWREPKPINPLPKVQNFDLEFLPTSIRARVEDVALRTSTPLDFAGIASVLCLAGVTGRRVYVYPMAKNKEWREAIALSGVIVAASGKTKTPVWKAFTDPIIENDAEWKEEHSKAMKVVKIRVDSWESQRKLAEKQKTSFDLPKPEEPPKQRRCSINDATPEALHSAMQDNPEGYLYYRDELSGFVEELDAPNRESQRTIFMTAMDGDTTYTMHRIGRGEVSAKMCASVCGNFQPNRLDAFLNNARNIEDGLVPRFSLMVYPQTDFHALADKTVNQEAKTVYRYIVRQLAKMRVGTVEMHFAADAQLEFTRWLEQMMRRIDREESEWVRSHLSKYKGVLPRIAALFQLVDTIAAVGQVTGSDVNFEPGAKQPDQRPVVGNHHLIDLAHLEQAMRFLDYLESHMHKVYNSVKSPLARAEETLAARIKDLSLRSGFTFRDITRKHWKHLSNPEIIREAITTLEQAHWIRLSPEPSVITTLKGGRPKGESWDVNPALV